MISLLDYFAPVNLYNFSLLVLFVWYCDVVGFRLVNLLNIYPPPFLRGTVWLIGLGLNVFFYFLAHLFISYNNPVNLLIVFSLFLFSISYYLKNNAARSLVVFLKSVKLPLIVVILVLPKLLIKSSLPPYIWDEMAYHYISPYALNFEEVWPVVNSFYQNLPRLLETAYVAMFALTKTYASARLLHFLVFLSFLLTGFMFFRLRTNYLVATTFFVAVLFHAENFLLWSTFGYVDIGTTSFVMISLFSFYEFYIAKNKSLFLYSLAFLGLAIGSKYSGLTQFISVSILGILILFIRERQKFIDKRLILTVFIVVITMGGYWYIKNLFFTGNPIYPFLLGCKFDTCETVSLSYTDSFSLSNFDLIFSRVFMQDVVLKILFVTSIITTSLFGNGFSKKVLFITAALIILEIILVKAISGYESRYFYHWQILSMIVIILPISLIDFNKYAKR